MMKQKNPKTLRTTDKKEAALPNCFFESAVALLSGLKTSISTWRKDFIRHKCRGRCRFTALQADSLCYTVALDSTQNRAKNFGGTP